MEFKKIGIKGAIVVVYASISCSLPFFTEYTWAWQACTFSWIIAGIVLFDIIYVLLTHLNEVGISHIFSFGRNLCVATLGNAILSSASVMNVNWYVFFIIALLHSVYSYLKSKIKWQHLIKTKQNKAR